MSSSATLIAAGDSVMPRKNRTSNVVTASDLRRAYALLNELLHLIPGWDTWDNHIMPMFDELLWLEDMLDRDGTLRKSNAGRPLGSTRPPTEQAKREAQRVVYEAYTTLGKSQRRSPRAVDVGIYLGLNQSGFVKYRQRYGITDWPPTSPTP